MQTHAIGIDYGTESGRVLIINVENGHIAGSSVIPYAHGVITETLPTEEKTPIPPEFALQHPGDYLDVIYKGIPDAIRNAGVSPEQIIGIGVDFTSSTMVVTDRALEPLCFKEQYENNPHAWVKLWKHHGPNQESQSLHEQAVKQNQQWLKRYGSHISTEWFIPKCFETLNQDPQLYRDADLFLEAGDWVVARLTGRVVRSNCSLGFKALWHEADGFPETFLSSIHPELGHISHTKLRGEIGKVGERAGRLTAEMAGMLGLPSGLPVAVAIIDAHAAVLGIGVSESHQFTMVMGTSTCHMMLNEREIHVPGISGVVKDAIIPGLYAYEAGQSAVGDLFGWYARQVPHTFEQEAVEARLSVFDLLEARAKQRKPGESGLVALDWHNGNRSILSNSDLTGLIIGLTLSTKPEDIYRAYLEATAFGARVILDNYEQGGLQVNEVLACGGLPQKNELLMQIYADVLNRDIHVSATDYAPAVGAAMLGAVAAGEQFGGFDSIQAAVKRMKQPFLKSYHPIKENVSKYEQLFSIYKQLHDDYGRSNEIMKKLKKVRGSICSH